MILSIQKWGNSGAVRLNKALLEQLSTDIGGEFDASITAQGLVLKPIEKKKYTLEGLLQSCNKENVRLSDDDPWVNPGSIGKEVI